MDSVITSIIGRFRHQSPDRRATGPTPWIVKNPLFSPNSFRTRRHDEGPSHMDAGPSDDRCYATQLNL